MLAVLKQAIPEALRGLSTGVIVWAGTAPCAPTLVCSACPDCSCTCDGATRRGPSVEAACSGVAPWWVAAALVVGALVGFVGARCALPEPRRPGGKGGRGVVLQLA
jgi:hypothetical protein